LFFAPGNLAAACRPCNYGGGSKIARQNTRAEIERLHETIFEQAQQIDRLLHRLAE
jgi:hypothetical protein